MLPSTARRERLVSPLNLALMAGVFVVAFLVLKPDSDIAGTSVVDAGNVDQLQLAYLKAQNLAGKSSDAEVRKVIHDLVNAGRAVQARDLLLDYPTLTVSEAFRFRIDMELAVIDSETSLFSSLEVLLDTPRLHNSQLLTRAVELSLNLKHPKTSMALYEAWAGSIKISKEGAQKAHVVYQQCAVHMVAVQENEYATSCYQQALLHLPESASPIDLQLGLLPLLQEGSNEQRQLLASLMQNDESSSASLERIAPALLAVQRPDLAYRIYARLAMQEPDAAEQWLTEAARWAQAAGKPADAAVFIESLANSAAGNNKVELYDQVGKLLVQAGKGRTAYERLRSRISDQPGDVALLARGITMARQVGELKQAYQWNTTLLTIEPRNSSALTLQSELALAAGDLPTALSVAQQRVKSDSRDVEARTLLAQVSEWNTLPQLALEQWIWLSQSGHGVNATDRIAALRQVVRLSKPTLRSDLGVQALRELTLLETPSEQDILQLVAFYDLEGRPDHASVALRDIIALHGSDAFTLRTLAKHEFYNTEYAASLDAWNQYVISFGHSVDSTLARMELLWRLDQPNAAMQIAQRLKGQTLATQASNYQLMVMSEIGWRNRLPWLTTLVNPRIDTLEEIDQQLLLSRRSLAVLQDSGENEAAMRESMKLWGNTGQADFALLAMQLAVKVDDKPTIAQFAPEQSGAQVLHTSSAYWTQFASIRLREGNSEAAHKAYGRALKLDEGNVEAMAGLLWLAIGEQDDVLLLSTLSEYAARAEQQPLLWQAMAVGYLQLGAASTSLVWFDRMLEQIDADYGMLLTYADALEYAGKASDARKVRQYALQQLRPLLIQGSQGEQELLLRQYARLSTRYDSVESNEALVDYLLDSTQRVKSLGANADNGDAEDLWREDMAISWLMSTQQFEHARLVMAQIHAKRLEAPAWQNLAIALKDKDNAALESIVQAKGTLSIGNHILALRQLGNDNQAYALAQNALAPGALLSGSGFGGRRVAQEQYVSLRNKRPGYVSGAVSSRSVGGLDSTDTGVNIRHSFAGSRLGVEISAFNRQYDSSRFQLTGTEEQTNLNVSLFYTSPTQDAQLTTGITSVDQGDQSYASVRYALRGRNGRSEVSAELAYNEEVNFSPELTIAGAQNRATLGLDADIGRYQFMRLRADVTEVNTRLEQNKLARGLGGIIELGVRGAFGSNSWSTSVTASQIQHDRVSVLPEELRLSQGSTVNRVLAEDVQRLSVGASLSRGGVNADYPQVNSPRYYVNSSLGQNWPEQVVSFQIDAGAGIRVLGGDELSFSVSHDSQPIASSSDDTTSLGMQYRYHFQ